MFAQVSLFGSLTYRFSRGKVPMSSIVLVAELMAQNGRTFWQRADFWAEASDKPETM